MTWMEFYDVYGCMAIMVGKAGRLLPGEFGHLEGNFAFLNMKYSKNCGNFTVFLGNKHSFQPLYWQWSLIVRIQWWEDSWLFYLCNNWKKKTFYEHFDITFHRHLFLENTFALHKPLSNNFLPPVMKYAHNFVEAVNACTITGLSEYFLIFVSSWFQFTNFR